MSVVSRLLSKINEMDIYSFTLKNNNGLSVDVSNFGATVLSIKINDRNNIPVDVALGFADIQEYMNEKSKYFGGTIGRCAGRVPNASFELNGEMYYLGKRCDGVHLHGGINSFNKVVWSHEFDPDCNSIIFSLVSSDGDNGYPGELRVSLKYTITENNELRLEYLAKTDKETLFNPTNHIYFNLAGHGCNTPAHTTKLYCSNSMIFNENMYSTGKTLAVKGTPLDFTVSRELLDSISETFGGYDHYYIADKSDFDIIAEFNEKTGGIGMKVYTNQPGTVLYATSALVGTNGKEGADYSYQGWFCIEPQGFPICPSQKLNDRIILYPGEEYYQITVFEFSI